MGQFASDLSTEAEAFGDGEDLIVNILEDLFRCFGLINVFSSNKKHRKRHQMKKEGASKRNLYGAHNKGKDKKPREYFDNGEIGDESNQYDNFDTEEVVFSKETVLGKTGSTMYKVEIIQKYTDMMWHPQQMLPKAKVKVEYDSKIWTMWQQVDNDLCIFGIPVSKKINGETRYLYVFVVDIDKMVNGKKKTVKIIRLMHGKEPIKNPVNKDDPRLFKLDYLDKSAGRVLFHIASLSYVGLQDDESLNLTDSRNSTIWVVRKSGD